MDKREFRIFELHLNCIWDLQLNADSERLYFSEKCSWRAILSRWFTIVFREKNERIYNFWFYLESNFRGFRAL